MRRSVRSLNNHGWPSSLHIVLSMLMTVPVADPNNVRIGLVCNLQPGHTVTATKDHMTASV